MKRLYALILIVLAGLLAAAAPIVFPKASSTSSAFTPPSDCKLWLAAYKETGFSDGDAVALGADVKFRRVVIVCNKDEARTANVGNVFVGCETGANKQPFTLSPGAEFVLEPPRGTSWSLKDWFVDAANNGDGVVITIS